MSMDKREITAFFDRLAPTWDEDLVRNEEVIRIILDNAQIAPGKRVLDVACGTGVLIPDYLHRDVASVRAIDLSPEMIRRAEAKFTDPRVRFVCGDVEETDFPERFDCIVVYNAFPHFPEPRRLIHRLSGLLVPGGTLTVAHGASREQIDRHHHGSAQAVSMGLMESDALAAIFAETLRVTVNRSDERMYQVCGVRAD